MSTASHKVEQRGDKVVIRGLELFCGFHPSFDKPESRLAKYGRERVAAIVETTERYMREGQFPQLVERHKRDGEDPNPAALGRVERIWMNEKDGVPYIHGDVEMGRDAFQQYIASNRFPRRSAEIWGDNHLSEVALLGRETPARPLADTRFTKQGDRDIFEMDAGTFPGNGNTAVPEFDPKTRKKETDMDELNDLKVECARLRAENDQLKAAKDTFEKGQNDLRDEFSRQIAAATSRIAAAEAEAKSEKYARVLDQMHADGYRVKPVRDELLKELCSASDADAKVEFFRKVITRDSTNHKIDQAGAVAGKEKFSAEHMDRAVRQANGDPKVYADILAGRIQLDA